MEKRLFIVSGRLPVTIDEEKGIPGAQAALFNNYSELFWAGSPGVNTSAWSGAIRRTPGNFDYIPVFIHNNNDPELWSDENTTVWQQVNDQFKQTLLPHLHPHDTVCIQDHQLILLPELLRKELPELTITFFMQTPFPAYKTFGLLARPWQEEILKGMLGADLVRLDDASHFLHSVHMALGLEQDHDILQHDNRLIKIAAGHMDVLAEITNIKSRQAAFKVRFLDTYAQNELLDSYQHASNRLILLDYDGTLVPFSSNPADAVPGDDLVQLIRNLQTERNTVCLISGRNREWLDYTLGETQANMIAEHGAFFKFQGQGWTNDLPVQTDWMQPVKSIMEAYVQRCAHSFIEEKQFSMVWHYRNAGKTQGALHAGELRTELTAFASGRRLKVAMGNKIVEVKSSSINKGEATRKVLAGKQFDFILAVGDDYTDEDTFKALSGRPNCYTIKVGSEASHARYNLFTPHTVIALLETISHITIRDISGRTPVK